jgi:hypothetical protein
MKKCLKCSIEKPETEFYIDGRSKYKKLSLIRYKSTCKECWSQKFHELDLEEIERRRKKSLEYYHKNKDKISLKSRTIHKEKITETKRLYRTKNKERLAKKRHENRKNRVDLNYKISDSVRSRIRSSLRAVLANKNRSSSELLGCSYKFLISYLESKFTKGMNWGNYGVKGWHMDHIIPCSSFNLSDPEEQKKCFHYTNVSPRWATTEIAISYGEDKSYIGNLEKNDKII